jgi:microcystin-dependent protein
MANQPETATYDAGVYQFETVDAVRGGVGGIANSPLLSLANRTAYLKQHVDNLENGTTLPPTVAPLNSPALTGSPTAPTPAAGDSTTKIATMAALQAAISSIANVAVAGTNIVLTQAQYGLGIVNFTGALTANINVTFPVNGRWLVINGSTGAFTITCKTAAGTGVAVSQGKTNLIHGDATNIALSRTDFKDAALTGNPTAPTQTAGDNSTKVATTGYVDNAVQTVAGLPTGSVFFTPLNAAPTGSVKANGALLSRTVFANLWASAQASGNITASDAAWSVTATPGSFSPGDGVTTFRIPDLRGIHIRSWDDSAGIDAARAIGSYQDDAFQGHFHNFYRTSATGAGGALPTGAQSISGSFGLDNSFYQVHESITDGTHGTPKIASETRPKNVALLACIKF